MNEPATTDDERLMAIALELAEAGLGSTAPNPSVGAVVARPAANGALGVIGRGRTEAGGRPHAEFLALKEAGDAARGATIYVTLEPCSHVGRGPACADVIIAAGIERAVIAIGDPDGRVAGDGIARLRAAGIAVDIGVLAAEAHWLTLGHILRVTQRRPFVQVKIAVDRQGQTPLAVRGRPQFVSGEAARVEVHRMRARADAVLTGIGTVIADDPDLRPRLPASTGRMPVRIVLDSDGRLPAGSKLAQSTSAAAPVWQISRQGEARQASGGGVLTFEVETGGRRGGLDLSAVLQRLADEGLTRVMVEAGPTLVGAFFEAGLVDEIVLIQSTTVTAMAGHHAAPFGSRGLDALDGWTPASTRMIDNDRIQSFRRPQEVPCSPA